MWGDLGLTLDDGPHDRSKQRLCLHYIHHTLGCKRSGQAGMFYHCIIGDIANLCNCLARSDCLNLKEKKNIYNVDFDGVYIWSFIMAFKFLIFEIWENYR